jgi:hypothetical protein
MIFIIINLITRAAWFSFSQRIIAFVDEAKHYLLLPFSFHHAAPFSELPNHETISQIWL